MTLELQSIGFKADTSDLLKVIEVMDQIGTTAEKNSKKVSSSFSDIKKATEALSSEKVDVGIDDNAISKAKAYVDQLNKAVEAVTKMPKGVGTPMSSGSVTGASIDAGETKKSVDYTERLVLATKMLRGESIALADGLKIQADGFSKSQAAALANLILMGKSIDEINKAKGAFEDLNRMSGVNTFDKSTSGAYRLKKQVEELILVEKLQAENIDLTRKEVVDYARDLERVNQQERDGVVTAKQALADRTKLAETYKSNASILRKIEAEAIANESASKARGNAEIRRAKELAAAQTYVYGTLEKLDYQLSLVEEGMGKGAANAAFKFEQSLKKLGLSVSEQERLLKQFGDAQTTLAVKQTKDKMDYVARAVAPQITDIVVGLSTGQSPMTVMLQQGGQLRDMFGQMGVASQDMSKVMRESMVQMAGSVKGTLLGMFGLVQGIFLDMGKAAGASVGKLSAGMTTAVIGFTQGKVAAESFKKSLEGVASEAGPTIPLISKFGAYLAGPFAIALAASAASLIAIGIAFKSAFDQQDALEKSLHTTGASFGFNASQAYEYAKSLNGISQSKAVDVMIEMAKVGGFTREQFALSAKSISDYSKVTGTSLSDTVKMFKDLEKDPVEALYKLNKAMGNIPLAAIAQVEALKEAGKASEALTLATNLLAKSQADAVEDIKGEWGTLFTMWMGMKSMFSSVGDWIKEAFAPIPTSTKLVETLKELNRLKQDWIPDNLQAEKIGQMQAEVARLTEKLNKEQADSKIKADSSAASNYLQLGSKELKKARDVAEGKKRETMSFNDYFKSKIEETYGLEFDKIESMPEVYAQAMKLKAGYLVDYNKLQEKLSKKEGAKSSAEVKTLKSEFDAQYQVLDKELQAQLDLNKKYHEAGILNDQQYFENQNILLSEYNTERILLIAEYSKKASAVGSKNDGFLQQLEKQKNLLGVDALKNYGSQIAESTKALNEFYKGLEKVVLENKLLEDQLRGQQDLNISMIGMTPDQQAAAKARFDMTEKLNKQQEEQNLKFKEAKKVYEAAGIARSKGMLDPATSGDTQVQLNQVYTDAKVVYDNAAKAMDDLKAKNTDLVKVAGDTAGISNQIARFKELSDTVNSINLGQTLASGFDSASNSVAGLINMVGKLTQSYEDYQAAKVGKDEKTKQKLDLQYGKNMIKTYGDMAGSAKGYFAEHTAGHKVLSAFEGIFKTMQMAEAAYTIASTAASAIRAAAAGVEALAVSLTGAPPPISFGMFAATAALLAGIGIMVAGAGSGGGSFAATNTGTGTVKGDPTAQSESIKNSLEELNKIDTMTMKYSAKMLVALNQIEYNTSGLADLLVSSGMIQTNASSAGIQTGFKSSLPASRLLTGSGVGIAGAVDGPLGMLTYTAIDKLTGGAVSGLVNKAFSYISGLFGTKTSIKGQGFNIGAQGLGDILNGGLSAQYYTDVEKKKKVLGVTTSTSRKTYYSETDKLFKDQISLIFTGFADSIKAASPLLGTSLQSVTDKLNKFVVNIGRVETSGLSQEDLQKRLSAVFSALGDNMASAILPGFEKFQKVGEGYYQTIVRVATGIEESKNLLDNFGIAVIDVNSVLNKQGEVAAEIVRDSILAGRPLQGIADIIAAISGSASDIAQAYSALVDVRDILISMGVSASATTSSLLAGAGGLSNLQDSLSSYQENFMTESERLAAKTAKLQTQFSVLGLQMPTTAQGFVALVKGIDTSTESGQKLLGRVLGLSEGFSEITTSIDDAAQATTDFMKSILDYVNQLDVSSSNVAGNFAQAKALFAEQFNLAKGGDSSARGNITSYADKLLEAAKNQASSAVEYQTILASVKSELLGLTTGVYSNTVLTSDINSLQSSNSVSTATQIADQAETTQELLTDILSKLTEMQTEDRAEGQSSITKLSTIEKIFKRIDNDDSIRVHSV